MIGEGGGGDGERRSRGVAWWVSDHCRHGVIENCEVDCDHSHGVIEVVYYEFDFVIIIFTVSSRLCTTRLTL